MGDPPVVLLRLANRDVPLATLQATSNKHPRTHAPRRAWPTIHNSADQDLSPLRPLPLTHLALPNPYHLTSSVSLCDQETQTQPPSNVLGLVSLIDSTLAWLCLPFDPVKLVHVFHAHAHSCAQRFLHPYRLGVNPKKIISATLRSNGLNPWSMSSWKSRH